MKVFVALFAVVTVVAAAPSGTDKVLQAVFKAKFNAFKVQHGKDYSSHEENVRLNNFLQNTQRIEEHNERYAKGLETFFMGHNEFSDMSFAEYLNTKLGHNPPTDDSFFNATVFRPSGLLGRPQSLDWRTSGAVTSVKNQGGCGSCYTFSALGSLEGMHIRKYGVSLDLSEQQLVDCTGSYGNGGCSGGWMHNAFRYIKDVGGINREQNYRYEGRVGSCRFNTNDKASRVSSHVIIPRDNEESLADAVAQVGPIAIAYDASTREHMNYAGGIYDSASCDKMRTSHAVVLVGYGTENNVDFWILKNSWGATWGENGYFRMRRNTGNRCGIATMSSYPIVA